MQNHAHGGVVEHAAQDGVLAADFFAVADFTRDPMADQKNKDQDPGQDVDGFWNQNQARMGQDVVDVVGKQAET